MTQTNSAMSRFSVRALDSDDHHGHVVIEASFEAAAIAFLEDRPLAGTTNETTRVLVRDLDSGQEHCFRIDPDTGAAAPRGRCERNTAPVVDRSAARGARGEET